MVIDGTSASMCVGLLEKCTLFNYFISAKIVSAFLCVGNAINRTDNVLVIVINIIKNVS